MTQRRRNNKSKSKSAQQQHGDLQERPYDGALSRNLKSTADSSEVSKDQSKNATPSAVIGPSLKPSKVESDKSQKFEEVLPRNVQSGLLDSLLSGGCDRSMYNVKLNERVKCSTCEKSNFLLRTDLNEISDYLLKLKEENEKLRLENENLKIENTNLQEAVRLEYCSDETTRVLSLDSNVKFEAAHTNITSSWVKHTPDDTAMDHEPCDITSDNLNSQERKKDKWENKSGDRRKVARSSENNKSSRSRQDSEKKLSSGFSGNSAQPVLWSDDLESAIGVIEPDNGRNQQGHEANLGSSSRYESNQRTVRKKPKEDVSWRDRNRKDFNDCDPGGSGKRKASRSQVCHPGISSDPPPLADLNEGAVGGLCNQQEGDGHFAPNVQDECNLEKTWEEEYSKANHRNSKKERDRGDHNGHSRRRDDREKSSNRVVEEIFGDLFMAPSDNSLAHCVAEDLRMGSGIAVTFKQNFKRVDELLDQRKRTGHVAVLEDNGRFIYYLITKKESTGKPRLSDLELSLQEMKEHCIQNGVKKIAMPRIGCGLDRLQWTDVKSLLIYLFSDTEVHITVYNFQEVPEATGRYIPKSGLYISHHQMSLVSISSSTGLVFLGTEDSFVDHTIEELDKKFRFITDYQCFKKNVGDVIVIKKSDYLYGLIVKKTAQDPLSFVTLNKCLRKLSDLLWKDEYRYFGMEAFIEDEDDLTMEKVCVLLKNVFFSKKWKEIECWICWPDRLKNIFNRYHSSSYSRGSTYSGGSQAQFSY